VERTLVILRHAKAVRPGGLDDVDRPLTDRGHRDAAAAGAWLVAQGLIPDAVLCSPSARTRETWDGVGGVLPSTPPVRYEGAIYLASLPTLVAVVRSAPEDAATVLLIGHNPGVTYLSATLDPDGDIGDGLRTSAVVVHRFTGAWPALGRATAPLALAHTARS
jgi:phosphohistidine phosphatase